MEKLFIVGKNMDMIFIKIIVIKKIILSLLLKSLWFDVNKLI